MDKPTYILIADSNTLVLATLKRELANAGYTVYAAKTGMEVMSICRLFTVNLALIDITMPDLNGIEFANYVQYGFGVPTIVFSAEDDPKTIEQYMNIGVLSYVVKPINFPKLLPLIATALGEASNVG